MPVHCCQMQGCNVKHISALAVKKLNWVWGVFQQNLNHIDTSLHSCPMNRKEPKIISDYRCKAIYFQQDVQNSFHNENIQTASAARYRPDFSSLFRQNMASGST